MTVCRKKILILACVLTLALPLYAQEAEYSLKNNPGGTEAAVTASDQQEKAESSFWEFVDKQAYAAAVDDKEEKEILREEWRKLLGVDIFYPYFKEQEIEDWVSQKASVEVFKIKGRPTIEYNQFKYTFKIEF
ncbi:MAG: hypothetical protein ABIH40_06135 [Candidatus Omnitrophota bacterium]